MLNAHNKIIKRLNIWLFQCLKNPDQSVEAVGARQQLFPHITNQPTRIAYWRIGVFDFHKRQYNNIDLIHFILQN